MQLNIKQLCAGHAYNEKTLDFDRLLDLSAVKLWGGSPFSKPVKISGTVNYRSGIFTIRYSANFEMQDVCSRCLVPIVHSYDREFTHTLLIEFEDEEPSDGYILAPDGMLALDELVISDLLLEFGGVMLCEESCRGLCSKCGKNLNEGDCGCDLTVPDPRFQVLRDLLNENE